MTLQGKTVLVTGGTSGIGEATARAYAAAGADVVITGRDEERGREIVQSLTNDGARARFVRADLERLEDVQRLADEVEHVDVLVNNAGMFPFGATHEVESDVFDSAFALNVKAPFFLTAAIAPAMVDRGGGAIINLGSWIARLGIPIGSLYSSTKGAVETLTRAWAAEFGPAGVRVTAISPGVIRPPAIDGPSAGDEHPGEIMMRGTPADHSGTPDAIAHAAVYLASDEATFVHGTVIDVDGGRVAVAVITTG
jgi:NAD(P)-dependent dehydrogenase (short-subunit alcohol dehydrogenase family)